MRIEAKSVAQIGLARRSPACAMPSVALPAALPRRRAGLSRRFRVVVWQMPPGCVRRHLRMGVLRVVGRWQMPLGCVRLRCRSAGPPLRRCLRAGYPVVRARVCAWRYCRREVWSATCRHARIRRCVRGSCRSRRRPWAGRYEDDPCGNRWHDGCRRVLARRCADPAMQCQPGDHPLVGGRGGSCRDAAYAPAVDVAQCPQ